MDDASSEWWEAVSAALAVGQKFATSVDEFNLACGHIVQLLEDASTLLQTGSHSTATFLAITAIEETAKTHIGSFRKSEHAVKRSKDPLYQHQEKHKMAVGPTVSMGERIVKALGTNRLCELVGMARSGQLVRLREAALYVSESATGLQSPATAVTRECARELLLLAVEVFDDSLVGYSNYTYELSARTDKIFHTWCGAT